MEEISHNSLLSSHGEVVSCLTTLFEFHNEVIKGLEEEYNDNLLKIKDVLFGGSKNREKSVAEKTPQQIKKRSKHLTAVDEEENNVSGSSLSQHDVSESSTTSKKSMRPPRAAKMNLNLKEKPLGQKIRRPSNFDVTNHYIKQEKTDDTTIKSERNKNDVQNFKSSSKVPVEPMEVDHNEKNLNSDASILIVQKPDEVVELESDGETDKMPPPQLPALKKRTVKKKLSQELLNVALPKPIKIEKTSMELTDSTLVHRREETDSDMSQQTSTTPKQKKKRRNAKGVPKPIIIKEEKLSLSKNDIETIENNKKSVRNSKKSNRGGSFESVYEDAVAHQIENLKISNKTNNIEFMNTDENQLTNIVANHKNSSENSTNVRTSVTVADSTFVSAKDIPAVAHKIAVAMTDATFVQNTTIITPTQKTFVVDEKQLNLDATTTIKQGNDLKIFNSDATFDIAMNPEANPSETYVRESIMTEDNSQDENEIVEEQKHIAKTKYKSVSKMNKNQIFNPFIQSPLKKKIEAFEKVAADAVEQNPPPRQTRTKTRAKQQQNENVDIQNKVISALKEPSKNITPSIGRPLGRILTPSQSSSAITPTIGAVIKKMPNSASKAIGITKALTTGSKISTGNQSTQQSRDNSIERGYRKFQELAAERKKKREEKQQQATLVREQKEKERADRLKRLMEEREEKLKAAEQKRNAEEIQKNLKLLEEKNEQKKKLEKQKLLEKQAAVAAAKKEREILENLKIQKAKEEMQLKLLKNQKEMKFKEVPLYNFDMLQTDDETDDEDEIAKKRPPLPHWSKKEIRRVSLDIQSYLPTAITDNFFSVQPLTPDLKDIFPTIDPRYCRRNSSAYWSTPPRYSQLPKY